MAKANYLSQIRKRMDDLQKEFSALSEAHRLLAAATGTRGRKANLPTLGEMVTSIQPKAKKKGSTGKPGRPSKPGKPGKPGRPPGSRSKAGSKKPGPKPKAAKAKASAKPTTSKPATSNVEAKVAAVVSKPRRKKSKASKKPVNVKSAAGGKRKRIGNVSGKITDIVAKANRFTTNSFITDKLVSLYPDKSRTDLGKYISVILANMKSRKELLVLTTDAKGNKMRSGLWGLPSWFDGAKPKTEFLK